jgi:hypothetical protein
MTNAKVTRLFPDAVAGATKARECAAEEQEQKTRNAYYVLSDVLLELAESRSENARLRAELAAR